MTLAKPEDKNPGVLQVRIESEQVLYRGYFRIKQYLLRHGLFRGGDSQLIRRELFCRGDSVGVLPYDPETDRVGLACQFRIGCVGNEAGPWVWEVIAGVNDKNENSEAVALRELREESGLVVDREQLLPICRYYSSPGGSDERLQLYCGITRLFPGESIFGLEEENEDILFKTFDADAAINAMLKGEINNAATVIALQWLQLNRQQLKERFCTRQPS